MFCGGALMLLVGLLVGESKQFHPANITPLSLGAFAYLVLIGAIVGYTAYFWLLRHCDPAKVATYAYVNPVGAVFVGGVVPAETGFLVSPPLTAADVRLVALNITPTALRNKTREPITPSIETANRRTH